MSTFETEAFSAEVAEATAPVQIPAVTEPTSVESRYTDEDIARVRSQEKDKLYPQIESLKDEVASLKREREERVAEEDRQRAEAEAEARAKAEADMDVRTLLESKEREWQEQLETERNERERAFALLEHERQYQDLMSYRAQRVAEEQDQIIPELLDLVSGSTPEEIEASIAGLRERSSRILDSAQSAMQSARREMAGARVTAPAAGPLENNSDNQSFSPEQVAGMSFTDYVKHRSKLLGQASAARNSGLFG
jgi:hypothetical protein